MTDIYIEDLLDHPLDEPLAFGCTVHGLVLTDSTRMVGDTVWPVPNGYMSSLRFAPERHVEDFGDTHLLRVPGQPELDWDAEIIEAEAAAGRVWQNYAVLSGMGPGLFGHPLRGWVYIDDAGGRWLIKPADNSQSPWGGQLTKGSPVTLRFTGRPFGELGVESVEPWTISATLADIGQADPSGVEDFAGAVAGGALVYMRVASISSTGRNMIIGLYPSITYEIDVRDMPYGFLMLAVSGTGGDIALELSVLRNRQQVLGNFGREASSDYVIGEFVATTSLSITLLERDAEGAITRAEGEVSVNGFEFHDSMSSPAWPHAEAAVWLGQQRTTHHVSGRIMMLVFDDSDEIVEFSAYMSSVLDISDQSSPGTQDMRWRVELGGSSEIVSDTATFLLRHDQRMERSLTLYRNGVKLQEVTASYELSGEYTWTPSVEADTLNANPPSFAIDWEGATVTPNLAFGRPNPPDIISVPTSYGSWRWDISVSVDGAELEHAGAEVYRDLSPVVPWQWHRVMTSLQLTPGVGSRRFDYAAQRLSNSLLAGRYELRGGNGSDVFRVPAAFGPKSTRVNPEEGNDDSNHRVVRGSYHPLTHAIHLVTRQINGSYPFGVWV